MLASEARKLSEACSKGKYEVWLLEVLKKIKTAATQRETSTYIYLGNGSYHNREFVIEIEKKRKMLKEKGYIISLERTTGWGTIFGSTFDYYFEVKW